MSIMTHGGRTALAYAMQQQPIYIAWGRGLEAWDSAPERENRNAVALRHEVGRIKAQTVQFCTPAEDGPIIVIGGRYRQSDIPTPHLHIRGHFEMDDGLGEVIRELGLFMGTQLKTGLPKGQRYFQPNDVQERGALLAIDHITPITRGVGAQIAFDFVITF